MVGLELGPGTLVGAMQLSKYGHQLPQPIGDQSKGMTGKVPWQSKSLQRPAANEAERVFSSPMDDLILGFDNTNDKTDTDAEALHAAYQMQ